MTRYLVVGPHRVGGKSAGEHVHLALSDAEEAHLLKAGHLVLAPVPPPEPSPLPNPEATVPKKKSKKESNHG